MLSYLIITTLFGFVHIATCLAFPQTTTSRNTTYIVGEVLPGVAGVRDDPQCCHKHGSGYANAEMGQGNATDVLACQSGCRFTTSCQSYAFTLEDTEKGNCKFYGAMDFSLVTPVPDDQEDDNEVGWFFSKKYCDCFDYCYAKELGQNPFGSDDRCW